MRASKNTRIDEGRNFLQERPPDCAAVGASDVLTQVVQEDPVSAEVEEEYKRAKQFQGQTSETNHCEFTCCTS